MTKYIETTEAIFIKYQGHREGFNAINIVRTNDGRYITGANVPKIFPDIFTGEYEEIELTRDDFPVPEVPEFFHKLTELDIKKEAKIKEAKIDAEKSKKTAEDNAKAHEVEIDKLTTIEDVDAYDLKTKLASEITLEDSIYVKK